MRKYAAVLILCLLLAGCGADSAPDQTVLPGDVTAGGVETPIPKASAPPAEGEGQEEGITAYGEVTPAVKTVLEHIAKQPGVPYGAVAYQQTGFEGGTLVLAEGLHDGENHPELYFVGKENAIQSVTTGSGCWELNFTEFSGKRIYYGQTYSKTPVSEVVLGYSGGSESIAPHSPGVIAVKNASEGTAGFIENVQGYILISEKKGLPATFEIKKDDGQTVDYIQEMLSGIPDYADVEDPGIRYASLFQYNRMAQPGATEGIGPVSLQSGENQRQLEFAGYVKDASPQDLFKSLSVYALCANDLYQSEYLPAGGRARLVVSEQAFPRDAEIRCYFSRLTRSTWDIYKKTGSVDFLRTMKKPDEQGNLELLESKGYYLIAVCMDIPELHTGTMVYTGVIGLG